MWLTATGVILHRVSSSPASAQQSGRHRRSLYNNDVVRSTAGWRATKVLSVYTIYMPIQFYGTGVYDLSITKMMAQSFDITFASFMYGDFLYTIRKQWEQKQTSHVIWLLILNFYLFRLGTNDRTVVTKGVTSSPPNYCINSDPVLRVWGTIHPRTLKYAVYFDINLYCRCRKFGHVVTAKTPRYVIKYNP